ncbi:MAG: radical SAM protein [Planctomycetota bacterium]|jgi:putative pyruvate formate lyase activating enzyme
MRPIPADFKICPAPVRDLWKRQAACDLCPRQCGVNRLAGEIGYCKTTAMPVINSCGPHFGEEEPLVGLSGSGTVFFAGCNLRCVYCQNADISHSVKGQEMAVSELADIYLSLQNEEGCHNINLVSPSHQVGAIAVSLDIAKKRGLHIPVIYNTGGYDSVDTIKQLEGLIDIYMPDMKYNDPKLAKLYSDAADYPEVNCAAVKEMHRQVGNLKIEDGIATRGLLVRHLVLPGDVAGSIEIMNFLKAQVSLKTAINIMNQYRPCLDAHEHPPLDQPCRKFEVDRLITYAREHRMRVIE